MDIKSLVTTPLGTRCTLPCACKDGEETVHVLKATRPSLAGGVAASDVMVRTLFWECAFCKTRNEIVTVPTDDCFGHASHSGRAKEV